MVLWKKESVGKGVCYVDLLPEGEQDNIQHSFARLMHDADNKRAAKSTELRTRGNQQFKAKNWNEAMNLYNKSLRYGSDGSIESENVSLAYANRSVCFFQMKKYEQCLADIELAKKANYPERLMHKLVEREVACLKLINDEPAKSEQKVEPALSFDADEKFPCFANVLELRTDDDHSKHIVAKQDIDVDQIVMLEEMYIHNIHSEEESYCKTCLKSAMNFIPCRTCSDVLFCDDKCMASNKIHQVSCITLRGQTFSFVRVVESILMAVTAFPNAGALMEFVESALGSRDLDAPKCDSDGQRKYRSFLKLNILADRLEEEKGRVLPWSYRMLSEIPAIYQCFRSKPEKRFLMHLILQHDLICINNGTLFNTVDFDSGESHDEVSGVCFLEAQLNHSCTPNASYQRHGNKIFVYAVRPIVKGNELRINNGQNKSDNQCQCSKCVPRWKQVDLDRMKLDQDYQDAMQYHMYDFKDPTKRPMIKAKLGNLMRKYGELPWTREFEAISALYDHSIRFEYAI